MLVQDEKAQGVFMPSKMSRHQNHIPLSEYIISAELGGFATIEVVMPEHVQAGSILAIRRNTGILGRVTVTDVTAQGAIASPMPGFGPVEPQAGDELIIPPQF